MEITITEIADFIKRYKSIAEFSFTIGKYTKDFGFDKKILNNSDTDRIEELLKTCNTWEDKDLYENNEIDLGYTKTIDFIVYTIENGPYDIIVSADIFKKTESYVSEEYIKKINTYTKKSHCFKIVKEYSIKNGDENTFILTLQNKSDTISDMYNSHSSILKILDIIKTLDKEKNKTYLFKKIVKN